LRRQLDDTRGVAAALANLAEAEKEIGRHRESMGHLRQSIQMWRELGEVRALAIALHNLGDLMLVLGDPDGAELGFSESLALRRERGNAQEIAESLVGLGRVAIAREHWSSAQESLLRALAPYAEADDASSLGQIAGLLALVEARLAEPLRAATLLGAARKLTGPPPPGGDNLAALSAELASVLGPTAFRGATEAGNAMRREDLLRFSSRVNRPAAGSPQRVLEASLLPDEIWVSIEPIVSEPRGNRRGRPRADDRKVLAAILYKFRTDSPWSHVPEALAAPSTAHDRYARWLEEGILGELVDRGYLPAGDLGLEG
jgi:tetratricopeptide (TPR) repeat protein